MKKIVLIAASMAFLSGAASARTATVTYKGTVSYGYDQSGRFGTAGTELTGLAFETRYVFDLSNYTRFLNSGETFGDGASSPARSATITINNVTYAFSTITTSSYLSSNSLGTTHQGSSVGNTSSVVVDGAQQNTYQVLQNVATAFGSGFPSDNYFSGPTNFSEDSVFFENFSVDGGQTSVFENLALLNNEYITVDVEPVVSESAVPEPATWAMMTLGFGAIGFAMRRKKVATRIRFA